MQNINLKSVGKGVAIGLLAILGYTGVDMGVEKIQLSQTEYNSTRNYFATRCWKADGSIEWGQAGLLWDIVSNEAKSGNIVIGDFVLDGTIDPPGLKKLCKQMIKL